MAIKFDITGDNSQFIDAMKQVQQSVRTTSKAVTDAMDKQASAVIDLTNQMNALADEIERAEKAGDAKSVDEKRKAYEALSAELKEAKELFVEMQQTTTGGGGMDAMGNSSQSLRARLKELTMQIAELTLEYRNMSASEQQSARGKELLQKIESLTDEAGTLRDAMDDVNSSVRNVASDTGNWDALAGGINVASSAVGGLTGAASLLGVEEGELQEIQTKLQASLAISNALTVIQNNLQKQSALMLKISAIQSKAKAAADAMQAKGTVAATIAQKAFNAVAKANPYVLLAGAILSVVGALALFSSGSKKAAEEEKRRQEEAKKAAEQQKHMSETISNSVGNVIGKYKAMQVEWKNLKNEQEKIQWVKNNQQAFNSLGLAVNSVTDAEAVLVDMAPQVVAALKAVAEAEAYQQLYIEAVKDKIQNWEHRQKGLDTGDRYYTGDLGRTYGVVQEEWKKAGLQQGTDYTRSTRYGAYSTTEFELTEVGKAKIKAQRNAEALAKRNANEKVFDDAINNIGEEWEDSMKRAEDAKNKIPKKYQYSGGSSGGRGGGGKSGGGGSKWDADKAAKDRERLQAEWYKELYQQLQAENQAYTDAYVDSLEDSTDKILQELTQQEEKQLSEVRERRAKLIEDARQYDIERWKKEAEGNDEYNYKEKSESEYVAMIEEAAPGLMEALQYRMNQISVSFAEQRDKVLREEEEQQAAALREYLKEYGTYQEKRKAITEEYDKKIQEAKTTGEGLMLQKQQEEELHALDERYGLVTQAMADLFADASKKSVLNIQKIIDKYEALVKYLKGNKTTMSHDSLANLGLSEEDIRKVLSGEISIKEITDRLKELKGELHDRSPYQAFAADMKKVVEQFKSAKNIADMGEAVSALGATIKDFLPAIRQFGSDISAIFGTDDTKINAVVDGLEGLATIGEGVGQAMSGDVIGGTMAAVHGVAQMVKSLDGMFGADYEAYEKLVDQYDTLITVWDTLIDKKKQYIGESYGAEAMKAREEATRLLERETEAWRTLGLEFLNSGASVGAHSKGVRQRKKMNSSDWQNVANALGRSTDNYAGLGGRLEGLFSLTGEQLQNLREQAPEFWAKLNEETRQYLENIIDGAERLEEIEKLTREQLTSTTFDNVYDSFISSLSDMDKSAYDFSKDFEKYMFDAVLNAEVGRLFKDRLDDWYKDFANAMNDGMLSDSETAALRSKYDAIMREGVAMRDEIARATGYGSSSEGSATYNAASSFTQEQGDILNGRLTAIQINTASGNALRQQIVNTLAMMNGLVSGNYAALDDMRTLVALSNTHLEDIVSLNKKMLNDFGEKIDKIVVNTNNL